MNKVSDTAAAYAKAIVGFIAPGVVALVAAVQDGSQGGSDITGPEWVGIGAACVLTAAGVALTPNKDRRGVRQDESVQPPDGGGTAPVIKPKRPITAAKRRGKVWSWPG